MKILYLAHRIPYPPNKGDKIRSYHHVRYLAERHDLHLLTFFDEPEDEQWAAPLRAYCRQVVLVPLSPYGALARGVTALARGRSLSEGYFGSRAMREAIKQATMGGSFDVTWAYSSAMAQYLPEVNAPWRVADYVDVDSEKWRQFANHSRGSMRPAYFLEALRLRAFEARLGRAVDQVLFVSNAEADLFRSFCPDARGVRVIPNGVDTGYFQPVASTSAKGPPATLFTGALDYRPNIDAVVFFAREILPLLRREIPDARLLAVGHRPAPRLLREAGKHNGGLCVVGPVPDIRPYFAEAHVYVAPLRLSRGVQNKVLEAMAMHVPVVATLVAIAGLTVEPGTHVLTSDTPAGFAAAVLGLLKNSRQRERLAVAAARLIEQRYSWVCNLRRLDECLEPGRGIRAERAAQPPTAISA